MATRKKAAKKKPAKKKAAKRGATTRGAKKATTRKRSAARRPAAPPLRTGMVTHSELVSANPDATVAWAKKALGWKFGAAMPTPGGPYHMWRHDSGTGGGIRATMPKEVSGSVPYVEVPRIRAAYDKAIGAGATMMMEPSEIPGGMGWIATVSAPGGVPVGLWAPKE